MIVILAGKLQHLYAVKTAWQITMLLLALVLLLVAVYHALVLPRVEPPSCKRSHGYFSVMAAFFKKPYIGTFITFILLYRLGEAQLGKIVSLFMLDDRTQGELGLSTEAVGVIYGIVGVLALVVGGILGGIVVSRNGLKYWIWWMALAINLPNLAYVYLAWQQE